MAASGCSRKVSKSTSPDTPKPDPGRLRFRKSSRLVNSRDFSRVREQGKSAQSRLLRVGILKNGDQSSVRIGIITSRRVGGAVTRNKIRRRLREIARASLPQITSGLFVVIVAKSGSAAAAFEELKAEWLLLARRLSILPASE
jgi:ribonuclease P protein component